jgi:hypothetical protein
MVIWKNLVKVIVKALLPTAIIPAIGISLIIMFFGLTIDSLLAIIFLGEFYIIWGQLEVALRQTYLSALEYVTELKIETEGKSIAINGATTFFTEIKLKNAGKHLARNIHIIINTDGDQLKYNFITNLAPDETVFISSFKNEVFNTRVIRIEVDYEDILGNLNGMNFVKEPKFPDFLVVESIRRSPGILLSSLEDLAHIFRALTFSRKIKKVKKGSGNFFRRRND